MITKNKTILIFDLDDTLYKEMDYLRSAYTEIAHYLSKTSGMSFQAIFETMLSDYGEGVNVFESIILSTQVTSVTVEHLIAMYRKHLPNITLPPSHKQFLDYLKSKNIGMGLITDGRSMQQRHKIQALGLGPYFDTIIISEEFGSEKPHLNNFRIFETTYGNQYHYVYVGDNTAKDFLAPNALGWTTICLQDDGQNIHKQQFMEVPKDQAPQHTIFELPECIAILNL